MESLNIAQNLKIKEYKGSYQIKSMKGLEADEDEESFDYSRKITKQYSKV